jgi:hypothetical protein
MTLVVSRIDVGVPRPPASPSGDHAFGVDLDGRIGGVGCADAEDWLSATTDAPGVDNQLALTGVALFDVTYDDHGGTTLQRAIDDELGRGDWLRALRITGIDDAWMDDDVSIEVVRATATTALAQGASGELAPGQRFASAERLDTVHGRIVEGRLEAELSAIDLPLGALYPAARATRVRIEAGITPDGLSLGSLGGAVSVDDLVTIAAATGGRSLTRADLVTVLHPDLDPDPSGLDCASLSIGIGVAAVTATLE